MKLNKSVIGTPNKTFDSTQPEGLLDLGKKMQVMQVEHVYDLK